MICKDDITQDYLKSILSYCPETGVFVWLKQVSNVLAGSVAGIEQPYNKIIYRTIGIGGSTYLAHRLAWLYMMGIWPEDQIDHEDGDGCNNRWKNLREADYLINSKNRKLSLRNKSGLFGVRLVGRKWLSKIGVNGESTHLYWGNDLFEACCQRKAAEYLHGFHDNHGRKYDSSWEE